MDKDGLEWPEMSSWAKARYVLRDFVVLYPVVAGGTCLLLLLLQWAGPSKPFTQDAWWRVALFTVVATYAFVWGPMRPNIEESKARHARKRVTPPR